MSEYSTLEQAQEAASDAIALGERIGIPYGLWAGKCHDVSRLLLATGWFGPGRVARGRAPNVISQHSWMVLGPDVYDPRAVIVDPTIVPWLRRKGAGNNTRGMPDILVEYAGELRHRPHGQGSIWAGHGKPAPPTGEIIELTPSFELSEAAQLFLSDDVLGPLDLRGWGQLASGPMEQWPAGEIIAAMDDTPALRALVPIDILGMVTTRNPVGIYLFDDNLKEG